MALKKKSTPGLFFRCRCPLVNLKIDLGINQFEGFSVPSAILPRSFLKEVLILANEWLDVYGELPAYEREASRVRVLEPVSTPSDQ